MSARSLARVAVVLAALAVVASPAAAQSIWLDRVADKTIHLEIAKPLYTDADDVDFLTTSWWLATRLPVGSSLHFVGEIPFSRIGVDDESSSTLGNLYAGIETNLKETGGFWGEAGVRLPTASEDEVANITGTFVDADRWEAYGFASEAFMLHTAAHWRSSQASKAGVDLRVAPNLWLGGELDDPELFVVYGGQILYGGTSARAGAGITGRWLATEDEGGDLESTHQLEAAADFLAGKVRPGVTLRLPLDDDAIETDVVLGVTLNVLL